MPNYSKIGNYYIRKGGDDATGDGSASNPWGSFAGIANVTLGSNDVVVVGDGVYVDSFSNIQNGVTFTTDGVVLIDGSALPFCINLGRGVVEGFKLINGTYGIRSGTKGNDTSIRNVFIKNCGTSLECYGGANLSSTIIKNGLTKSGCGRFNAINPIVRNLGVYNDSILFEEITVPLKIVNSDFDSDSLVEIEGEGLPLFQGFFNCNIRGSIKLGSITYPDLSSAQTAYPGLFTNCFSSDPLFTDADNDDYSLRPGSPNLTNSSDGTFIGAKGLGFTFDVDDIESSSGVSITGANITLTGSPTGTVIFNPINFLKDYVLDQAILLGTEDYFGFLTADSDQSLLEPNQRTIEFKFVTQEEISLAGSLADALTLKSWRHFVRSNTLSEDGAGNSNYDANYDPISAQPIVAGAAQCRLTLRDNAIIS